MMVFASVVDTV